jgi:hypothetical protein
MAMAKREYHKSLRSEAEKKNDQLLKTIGELKVEVDF